MNKQHITCVYLYSNEHVYNGVKLSGKKEYTPFDLAAETKNCMLTSNKGYKETESSRKLNSRYRLEYAQNNDPAIFDQEINFFNQLIQSDMIKKGLKVADSYIFGLHKEIMSATIIFVMAGISVFFLIKKCRR